MRARRAAFCRMPLALGPHGEQAAACTPDPRPEPLSRPQPLPNCPRARLRRRGAGAACAARGAARTRPQRAGRTRQYSARGAPGPVHPAPRALASIACAWPRRRGAPCLERHASRQACFQSLHGVLRTARLARRCGSRATCGSAAPRIAVRTQRQALGNDATWGRGRGVRERGARSAGRAGAGVPGEQVTAPTQQASCVSRIEGAATLLAMMMRHTEHSRNLVLCIASALVGTASPAGTDLKRHRRPAPLSTHWG